MDFQSLNLLNVRLNMLSGNLLPITSEDKRFPVAWWIYSGLVWLIELMRAVGLILGIRHVPREKALIDGTVTVIFTMEVLVMTLRIQAHSELVRSYIQKLNDILRTEDETMKSVVMGSIEPMKTPLNFYWVTGLASVIIWGSIPFALAFQKNIFYYKDYRMPVAFSKQPFTTEVFVLGSLIISFGSMYMFLKKAGVDIYMVHLVLLMTVQYRYIAEKLALIFRVGSAQAERDDLPQKYRSRADTRTERELKALCRHHNRIIHLFFILKKLLALNFSLIYVNSVLRFCFIGIMLTIVLKTTFIEGLSIVMFACSGIVQFYVLCSCVQQLLDASTKMTDLAFHEKWYQFGPSIQRMFVLMILSNNLECKLATFATFNLSLPSFMSVLNQAYSFALLFLKMK